MAKRSSAAPYPSQSQCIYGFCYFLMQLLCMGPLLTIFNAATGNRLTLVHLNFIMYSINFLAILLIFGRFLFASFSPAFASPLRFLSAVFGGLIFYYGIGCLLDAGIRTFFPGYQNLNNSSVTQMIQENWGLMSFAIVFLAPVSEECLIRISIFRALSRRNRNAAYLLSSLVFSFIHVASYLSHYDARYLLIALCQYLPAGFCLAWAYEKTDSVYAPILIHITINFLSLQALR